MQGGRFNESGGGNFQDSNRRLLSSEGSTSIRWKFFHLVHHGQSRNDFCRGTGSHGMSIHNLLCKILHGGGRCCCRCCCCCCCQAAGSLSIGRNRRQESHRRHGLRDSTYCTRRPWETLDRTKGSRNQRRSDTAVPHGFFANTNTTTILSVRRSFTSRAHMNTIRVDGCVWNACLGTGGFMLLRKYLPVPILVCISTVYR